MNTMQNIGVGIVTCNRPDFYNKCLASVPEDIFTVTVNDGKGIEQIPERKNHVFIQNDKNIGVGKSKNLLFKEILKNNKDHIFIIEDDMLIKNSKIFEKYIKAREITGIQHFCFAYHGPANKNGISGGLPCSRFVIEYPSNIKIAIAMHAVGSFCYYTREVLEKVGLIDEEFLNAFEHVEHSYRIAKAGYTTPYWNWSDLADSPEYIHEMMCSEFSSAIRPRSDWRENIIKGASLFYKKHGYNPAWQNAVPDTPKEKIIDILKQIKKNGIYRNSI
jgi:GT2 family glycosyltransferase